MPKRKKLPSALISALESGDFDVFCRTMKKCEPNALTETGHNAFTLPHLTEAHIRWLIEYGTIINQPTRWGETPLAFVAARDGREEILSLLIRYGASIELGSPLHSAARHGRTENMRILMEHGADVEARNSFGQTPLEYALASVSGAGVIHIAGAVGLLIDSGAVITEKARGLFGRLAESVEFYRDRFPADVEPEVDAAMARLCPLFDMTPLPRRVLHDGISPICVPEGAWQTQFEALWDLLVPASGPCKTVQGEVIRVNGKIGHELLDNGGINWDKDFKQMLVWLEDRLIETSALTKDDQAEAVRRIHALTNQSVAEADHNELNRLSVKWVLNNPSPLPLGQLPYDR